MVLKKKLKIIKQRLRLNTDSTTDLTEQTKRRLKRLLVSKLFKVINSELKQNQLANYHKIYEQPILVGSK